MLTRPSTDRNKFLRVLETPDGLEKLPSSGPRRQGRLVYNEWILKTADATRLWLVCGITRALQRWQMILSGQVPRLTLINALIKADL